MIDVRKIEKSDCPMIVFSTSRWNLFNYLTGWKTKGLWTHVMVLTQPDTLLTQDWAGLRSVPLANYLKKDMRLKFWKIKNLNQSQRDWINLNIYRAMRSPWWTRQYDFLGIFGQAVGWKALNNPWKKFCVERVQSILDGVVDQGPAHADPEQYNDALKLNPRMEVYGYWEVED